MLNNWLSGWGTKTSIYLFPYLISSYPCDVIRIQLQLGTVPNADIFSSLGITSWEILHASPLKDHVREWRILSKSQRRRKKLSLDQLSVILAINIKSNLARCPCHFHIAWVWPNPSFWLSILSRSCIDFLGLPQGWWHKQQKHIVQQFWRSEVQGQGVGRAGFFLGLWRKYIFSLLLLVSGGLLPSFYAPWLIKSSPQSLF